MAIVQKNHMMPKSCNMIDNLIEDAKELLRSGLNVNVTKPNEDKWTALHCAANGKVKQNDLFSSNGYTHCRGFTFS